MQTGLLFFVFEGFFFYQQAQFVETPNERSNNNKKEVGGLNLTTNNKSDSMK